ncbi:DUF5675 family protein [Pantoea alhagi]|uniref:DUF5675 family protein n=1 Tax=Pantoea alhagi TaxID=1891675 RepID=UPI001F1676B5|nr:DUF5675 family protein [Pantoea alhagi]
MAYTIFVQRKWQTTLSTISEFSISGTNIKDYFLECPGPDTVTPRLKKRIPEGSYRLVWHTSGKFVKHNPPKLFNAFTQGITPGYRRLPVAWNRKVSQ